MKSTSEILKGMPLPAAFTFEEQTHIYRINSAELPSVTGILRAAGLVDEQWFTDESRDRGSAVHLAIQYLDEDALDEESLDERVKPYVNAYRKFKTDTGFEPLPIIDQVNDAEVIAEARRFQPKYGYAGTIDRIGIFRNGRKVILEIKTGAAHPTHRLQLAAYQAMLDKPGEYIRLVLRLEKDGTYIVNEFSLTEYPQDFQVFASCLQVVRFKKEHQL